MITVRILLDLQEVARLAGVVEQEPIELAALFVMQSALGSLTKDFHSRWPEMIRGLKSPALAPAHSIAALDKTSPDYLSQLNEILNALPIHLKSMGFLTNAEKVLKQVEAELARGKWRDYQ